MNSLLDKLKEFYQGHTKAIKLGILAVIALGAVSYGGLVFTSTPGFCNSCHEMNAAYNTWQSSVHAEVACVQCHVKPSLVAQMLHKVEAMKELYLHFTVFNKPNPPKIVASEMEPIDDACLQCHTLNRKYSFSGDLRMPHALHIKKGLTCPTCHSRVVHGVPGQRKPKVEVCLTCHNGKKAPNSCPTCHTKKAIPESHKQANWLQVHGKMSQVINCGKCHNWRPDWCMQCHKNKPQSHMTLWRTRHGARAKADRAGCNACHNEAFCMRCHGIQP